MQTRCEVGVRRGEKGQTRKGRADNERNRGVNRNGDYDHRIRREERVC
jgi:hypothetical protein